MFAILTGQEWTASEAENGFKSSLLSYGIDEILNEDVLNAATINGTYSDNEDVIIIADAKELDNLALRRLTLSSKRLPSHMIVWADQSQRRFIAARLSWRSLSKLQVGKDLLSSLEAALRLLQQNDPTIASYTIQHFTSTDALRLGGSWAKCAIRKYFTKTASGDRGRAKLSDEVNFYRSLPSSLSPHYLELLYARESDNVTTLALEYREDPNIRDLLMNFQITPQEASNLLRRVLHFEYHSAFLPHCLPTPPNYLQDFHYHRVWTRLAMCLEIDPGLTGLISARQLIINGEPIPNIPSMLYALEQSPPSATTRLTPPGVSPYIHGDTHLENILYSAPEDKFYLVDPRGYPACDIFYDLGKLSHSYAGGYDLIHEGRHKVQWSVDADSEMARVDYHFTAPLLWARYQELNVLMRNIVRDVLGDFEGKEDIELKTLFNQAMHFPSITPFHIHHGPTPNLTVPFYAVGAQTLVQVLRMLDIDIDSCLSLRDEAMQRLDVKGREHWKFGD